MLEIKNLTKIYPNGKKAVSNLSMTVADGDLCGFIGKNGAGKTTTLKACLTIHDFETGDILLNGLSIKSAPTECKRKNGICTRHSNIGNLFNRFAIFEFYLRYL